MGQISKNYRTFYPKMSLSSQKYEFGIRDLEKTYSGSRIQWSKRHRIPDPQHCHRERKIERVQYFVQKWRHYQYQWYGWPHCSAIQCIGGASFGPQFEYYLSSRPLVERERETAERSLPLLWSGSANRIWNNFTGLDYRFTDRFSSLVIMSLLLLVLVLG